MSCGDGQGTVTGGVKLVEENVAERRPLPRSMGAGESPNQ